MPSARKWEQWDQKTLDAALQQRLIRTNSVALQQYSSKGIDRLLKASEGNGKYLKAPGIGRHIKAKTEIYETNFYLLKFKG